MLIIKKKLIVKKIHIKMVEESSFIYIYTRGIYTSLIIWLFF